MNARWLLLLVLFCHRANGQGPVAAAIPDSMARDAAVVERLDEMEIEIESPRKAKIHHKYVYTILNSSGDSYAIIHTFYDKFNELSDATGILYDAAGHVLKKVRKADMEDWSTEGSGILMTDSRVKSYRFSSHSYPYSVSFEEDKVLNGLFVLPEWRPQYSPDMAVENSSLTVRIPSDYPLRYKSYHYLREPVMARQKGDVSYGWEIHHVRAVVVESFSPSWYRTEPLVRLAPGVFEEDGYKGSLYTWADMGKFIGSLYQGRDQLPPEAKEKVHQLADGLKDDREKIDVLYQFLQQNTHYVGIELGIGGWQPFDAAYVYSRKYGDCKALSNYMVALLKEAGIHACNVLINGGVDAPRIDTGFACNQFNHAIVLAFAGTDSVWLECTSQLLAPGYLGGFTCDRYALMLDEGGGKMVHTPVYEWKDNRLDRMIRGSIDSSGTLRASLTIRYSGLEQDAVQAEMDGLSKKQWLEQRQQSLGVSGCTITRLDDRTMRTAIPSIEETMEIVADHFSTVTGSRLFINPGIFLKTAGSIKEVGSPRASELELNMSYEETDSIVLQIPHGYLPEESLPSTAYSPSFGSYRIHGGLTGDALTLTCNFRQYKGIYPANAWPKIVRFFNLIYQDGNMQLVFERPR
jgi:transglutaminase-like putative cysteine protease